MAPTSAVRKPATPTIARVRLSDDSITHNVILTVEGTTFVFAATDPVHAERLAREINQCAWIERAA